MPKDDQTGITRMDLQAMRRIFDNKDPAIPRPRHCFRWNNGLERWELNEVAPGDRTLIAYMDPAGGGQWVEV